MKKQIVKFLVANFSVVVILCTGSNEVKAQVFFDISPSGNIQLCSGATVTITADPLPPGYTYQWMMEDYGFNGCDFNIVPIWGETNQSYTASATSVYWCEAIDINGQSVATSMSPAWVASLSDSVHICYNSSLNFCKPDSVYLWVLNIWMGPAFGTPSLQWQLNGADIPGADFFSYYAKTSGTYRCRLINSCGFKYTNSVMVTANPKPSALITANGSTTFCTGESVTLNAVVAANRTYQWKKNGTNISGATASSYIATASGTYKVTVTNTVTGCSKTTPTGTVVTKNPLPASTITPSGTITFCAGQSALLTANSGTGYTYKWKKNGNYISGATAINYMVATAGKYRAEVTNSYGCSKTSAADTIVVPCREGENVTAGNNFDINVYPNPSSGDFIFEIDNAMDEKISIEIYDMIGKLILSENNINPQFTIRNPQLSPGIYSAVVIVGENKKTIRIVKTD